MTDDEYDEARTRPGARQSIALMRIIAVLFSLTVWALIYRIGEALWRLS